MDTCSSTCGPVDNSQRDQDISTLKANLQDKEGGPSTNPSSASMEKQIAALKTSQQEFSEKVDNLQSHSLEFPAESVVDSPCEEPKPADTQDHQVTTDMSLEGEILNPRELDSHQDGPTPADPQVDQVSTSDHHQELKETSCEISRLKIDTAHLKNFRQDERLYLFGVIDEFKSDIAHIQDALFAQNKTIKSLSEETSLKANPSSAPSPIALEKEICALKSNQHKFKEELKSLQIQFLGSERKTAVDSPMEEPAGPQGHQVTALDHVQDKLEETRRDNVCLKHYISVHKYDLSNEKINLLHKIRNYKHEAKRLRGDLAAQKKNDTKEDENTDVLEELKKAHGEKVGLESSIATSKNIWKCENWQFYGLINDCKSDMEDLQDLLFAQKRTIGSLDKKISNPRAREDGPRANPRSTGPRDHEATTLRHLQDELEVSLRENRRLKTNINYHKNVLLKEKTHLLSKIEDYESEVKDLQRLLAAQKNKTTVNENTDVSLEEEILNLRELDSHQDGPTPADPQVDQVSTSEHHQELKETCCEISRLEIDTTHLKNSRQDERLFLFGVIGEFKSDIAHIQDALFAQNKTIKSLSEKISLKANPSSAPSPIDLEKEICALKSNQHKFKEELKSLQIQFLGSEIETAVDSPMEEPAGPQGHQVTALDHVQDKLKETRRDNGCLKHYISVHKDDLSNEKRNLWQKIRNYKYEAKRLRGDLAAQNNTDMTEDENTDVLEELNKAHGDKVGLQFSITNSKDNWKSENGQFYGLINDCKSDMKHLQDLLFVQKRTIRSLDQKISNPRAREDGPRANPWSAGPRDHEAITLRHLQDELEVSLRENRRLKTNINHHKNVLLKEKTHLLSKIEDYKSEVKDLQRLLAAQKNKTTVNENTDVSLEEEILNLRELDSHQDGPTPTDPHVDQVSTSEHHQELKDTYREISRLEIDTAHLKNSQQDERLYLFRVIDEFKSDIAHIQDALFAQNKTIKSLSEKISLKANPSSAPSPIDLEKEICALESNQHKFKERLKSLQIQFLGSERETAVDSPMEEPAGPQGHQVTILGHVQDKLKETRCCNGRLKHYISVHKDDLSNERSNLWLKIRNYKHEAKRLLGDLAAQKNNDTTEDENTDVLEELKKAHGEKVGLESSIATSKNIRKSENRQFYGLINDCKSDMEHLQDLLFAQKKNIRSLDKKISNSRAREDGPRANPWSAGPRDHEAITLRHLQDELEVSLRENRRLETNIIHHKNVLLKEKTHLLSKIEDYESEVKDLQRLLAAQKNKTTVNENTDMSLEEEILNPRELDSHQDGPTPTDPHVDQVSTSDHHQELKDTYREISRLEIETTHLKNSRQDERLFLFGVFDEFKSDIAHIQDDKTTVNENTDVSLEEEISNPRARKDGPRANPRSTGPRDHQATTSGHLRHQQLQPYRETGKLKYDTDDNKNYWPNEKKKLCGKIDNFKSEVIRVQGITAAQEKDFAFTNSKNEDTILSLEKEISVLKDKHQQYVGQEDSSLQDKEDLTAQLETLKPNVSEKTIELFSRVELLQQKLRDSEKENLRDQQENERQAARAKDILLEDKCKGLLERVQKMKPQQRPEELPTETKTETETDIKTDKTKNEKKSSFFKWLTSGRTREDQSDKRTKSETKQREKEEKQKQLDEEERKKVEKKAKKEKKQKEKKKQKQLDEEQKRLEKKAKKEKKQKEEEEKKQKQLDEEERKRLEKKAKNERKQKEEEEKKQKQLDEEERKRLEKKAKKEKKQRRRDGAETTG